MTKKQPLQPFNLKYLLPRTRFNEYLVEYNRLDERGFDKWIFHPGMLFHSTDRWWGDGGSRDHPHQGLDLCLYRDGNGEDHTLDGKIKIPLIYDGEVVRVIDDYIGKSVFLIHDICDDKRHQLYSIYGHTEPHDGIGRSKTFHEGDVIATIKDTNEIKVDIMPHLHVSLAWAPKYLPYNKLDWKTISNPDIVTLLNPLEFIDCQYSVLEDL